MYIHVAKSNVIDSIPKLSIMPINIIYQITITIIDCNIHINKV